MDIARMTVRLPVSKYRRLADHRKATRVPTNAFVEMAIDAALEKYEQQTKPKPSRRRAAG